jgi:hypothetical protein
MSVTLQSYGDTLWYLRFVKVVLYRFLHVYRDLNFVSLFTCSGALYTWLKRLEQDVDYSPLPSVGVKNELIYISTPPRVFMV